MRHTLWIVMLGVACLGFSGCGKSEDPAPVATVEAPPAQPEEVLQQFLTAVKAGEKDKAENLLTVLAREKTAAEGLGINNLNNANVSFAIQGKQLLAMPDGKEAAHVSCAFTEKLEDGTTETHNIIWALRKETAGWRVAGMAFTPFPGELPVLMNFEDPADMLQKQKLLAEEHERRANPQATKPDTTVAGPAAAGASAPGQSATAPASGIASPANPVATPTGNASPLTNNIPTPQTTTAPQNAERFTAPTPLR